MKYLYLCNTSEDSIYKIDLDMFKVIDKLNLSDLHFSFTKSGPHGLCNYGDKLISANIFSNNISIIDMKTFTVEDYFSIGLRCNDIIAYNNMAYVICGDSNSVLCFDLLKKRTVEEIPCGQYPHRICVSSKGKILVANMENDSVTIIDALDTTNNYSIRVGPYPTKAVFSISGDEIIVCESNLGADSQGTIAVYAYKTQKLIKRIKVGLSPVDILNTQYNYYVSNFGAGTVSVLASSTLEEVQIIHTGGMPRSLGKRGRNLYISDNYNNLLISYDLITKNKNTIPVGCEPTGMVLL